MLADQWARELWFARQEARVVRNASPGELELDRARGVAEELYAALAKTSPLVGWKLGATDPRMQASLGTDRPFTAPIYADGLLADREVISLSRFIAPRLEAEIGLRLQGPAIQPVPCVEIIDCRFAGWRLTLPGVIADFGLQGAFVFGGARAEDSAEFTRIEATVTHDGIELQRGSAFMAEAVARLQYLGQELNKNGRSGYVVATGSLISPIPLEPGQWVINFGEVGSLSLTVRP
jgi:2-keto-4-pentenoate hydratase